MAAPAADDAPSTFTHRGWTFTHASTARIAAAPALDALSSALALGAVPLPEMTFAANFLEVRHAASGFAVRFDAAGALGAWHAAQVASSAVVAGAALPVDVTNYDCTYTTAYEGDGAALPRAARADARLPLERLREQPPILAYARVPLFASDLNDRGVVEALVKLRVMDDAFLLLFRAYTRLDHVRVRLHDVRLYHAFGAPSVLKDVQLRVAAVADVVAAGAGGALPAGPPSFFASPPAPAPAPAPGTPADAADAAPAASPPPARAPPPPPPLAPPSPPPRTVHPVVLASMRERAARQGLFVTSDGEVVAAAVAAAPPAPEHAASFLSPPPAARAAGGGGGGDGGGGGAGAGGAPPPAFAMWPARPSTVLALSPPTLLARAGGPDAENAPLNLDVSAEDVYDRVAPLAHDVFELLLAAAH
jgi:type 2A phosphatase activator TIP41